MRPILRSILIFLLAGADEAKAQRDQNGKETKLGHSFVKLEVQGRLAFGRDIDSDPKILTDYEKHSNVKIELGPTADHPESFELFVRQDAEMITLAKTLKDKCIVVHGDLVIVHAPLRVNFFGSGYERPLPGGGFAQPMPRYVIKVVRLAISPLREHAQQQRPYVKFEAQGVLETNGMNPPLSEIVSGESMPGTTIHCNPCGFRLFLGTKDEWLERAKDFSGKAALVTGELKYAKFRFSSEAAIRALSSFGISNGYYFLKVSNLVPPLQSNNN